MFAWRRRPAPVIVTDPGELRKMPSVAAYFRGFTPCDRAARGLPRDAPPEACREAYMAGVLRRPSPQAVARLQRAVGRIREGPDPEWRVALLDEGIEGGWPHTHGDVVCMPQAFVLSPGTSDDALDETMRHERIHVLQRLGLTTPLSIGGEMRRYPVDGFPRGSDVAMRRRSNPDLDGYLYVDPRVGLPYVSMFPDETAAAAKGLAAASVRWVDPETGDEVEVPFPTARAPEYEHPNEAQAYTQTMRK